jgi:hypothetical protein
MILHSGVIRYPRQELENQLIADLAARPCTNINGFEIEKRLTRRVKQGRCFPKKCRSLQAVQCIGGDPGRERLAVETLDAARPQLVDPPR